MILLVIAMLVWSSPAWAVPKNYLPQAEQPVAARCVSADGLTYESCSGSGASASVDSFTIAASVTTNATSTAVAGIRGTKTFYGSVNGTGSVTQTQVIYGGLTSGVTSTTGEPVCTFTLSGTTHAHGVCVSTSPWLYYIVVTTNTTGTGASGDVTAMY